MALRSCFNDLKILTDLQSVSSTTLKADLNWSQNYLTFRFLLFSIPVIETRCLSWDDPLHDFHLNPRSRTVLRDFNYCIIFLLNVFSNIDMRLIVLRRVLHETPSLLQGACKYVGSPMSTVWQCSSVHVSNVNFLTPSETHSLHW